MITGKTLIYGWILLGFLGVVWNRNRYPQPIEGTPLIVAMILWLIVLFWLADHFWNKKKTGAPPG